MLGLESGSRECLVYVPAGCGMGHLIPLNHRISWRPDDEGVLYWLVMRGCVRPLGTETSHPQDNGSDKNDFLREEQDGPCSSRCQSIEKSHCIRRGHFEDDRLNLGRSEDCAAPEARVIEAHIIPGPRQPCSQHTRPGRLVQKQVPNMAILRMAPPRMKDSLWNSEALDFAKRAHEGLNLGHSEDGATPEARFEAPRSPRLCQPWL